MAAKVRLMAVTRRGGNKLEYDILAENDAILVGGLSVPFTNETSAAQWQALCLAAAPAERDAYIASLESRKAELLAQWNAINAQIAALGGALTNG